MVERTSIPRRRERSHRRRRRLIAELAVAAGLYVAMIGSFVLGRAGVESPLQLVLALATVTAALGLWLVRDDLRREGDLAERHATGADAEDLVDAALRGALEPHGYRVLRAIPLGGEDADHVVVGPTGLWVVETKATGGRVRRTTSPDRLDGLALGPGRDDPIPSVERIGGKLRTALSRADGRRRAPVVHAAVALPNARVDPRAARLARAGDVVLVGRPQEIADAIATRRRCLDAKAIARWADHCERIAVPAASPHRSFRMTGTHRAA